MFNFNSIKPGSEHTSNNGSNLYFQAEMNVSLPYTDYLLYRQYFIFSFDFLGSGVLEGRLTQGDLL